MMILVSLLLTTALWAQDSSTRQGQLPQECVVLLHGLARVSDSMSELQSKLQRAGYVTVNTSYPSRRHAIPRLADDAVGAGVRWCTGQDAVRIHLVGHSLGGILIRHYLQEHELPNLGRVVMMGTPNQGAAMVDGLRNWPGFGWLGPSASALGTDENGIIGRLKPVDFELGVIAGDININPLAALWLDGENDSVVTVASTRVQGMKQHLVLPVIHSIMMRDNEVIDHTIHFLKTGQFIPR